MYDNEFPPSFMPRRVVKAAEMEMHAVLAEDRKRRAKAKKAAALATGK